MMQEAPIAHARETHFPLSLLQAIFEARFDN